MTMTGGEGRGPGATNGQCAIPDTVAATHASRDCTALNTHASRNSLRRSSEQAQATGNTLSYFFKKKRNCCSVLVLSCSHCLRHTSCGSASAATCEGTSAHHGIFLTLQSDSGDLTPKGQDSCGDLFKRKRQRRAADSIVCRHQTGRAKTPRGLTLPGCLVKNFRLDYCSIFVCI